MSRAQQRLAALDEERVELVSELEECQARPQQPQEATPAVPVPAPDSAAEFQRLQSLLIQFAGRKDSVGPRHLEEKVAGPPVGGRLCGMSGFSFCRKGSVGSDTTMDVLVISPNSDPMAAVIEEGETRQDGSRPHQDMMMLVVRGTRYGL